MNANESDGCRVKVPYILLDVEMLWYSIGMIWVLACASVYAPLYETNLHATP